MPPRSVMLSVGEIAARDGVSAPAVSRRVKQLRERGLMVETDHQGRVVAVNSVQYDELRGRFDDPSKRQAPMRRPSVSGGGTAAGDGAVNPHDPRVSESYDEALRQKTWTEAERARLRLAEEKGQLVRVDALADALAMAGGRIVQSIDRILISADDLAASIAKDGTAGVRAELKKIAHRIKTDVADALAEIASATPESDSDTSAGAADRASS